MGRDAAFNILPISMQPMHHTCKSSKLKINPPVRDYWRIIICPQ